MLKIKYKIRFIYQLLRRRNWMSRLKWVDESSTNKSSHISEGWSNEKIDPPRVTALPLPPSPSTNPIFPLRPMDRWCPVVMATHPVDKGGIFVLAGREQKPSSLWYGKELILGVLLSR